MGNLDKISLNNKEAKLSKSILIIWILINSIIGFFIVDDFGIGADTIDQYLYGIESLKAYKIENILAPEIIADELSSIHNPYNQHNVQNLKYYGAAFEVSAVFIATKLSSLVPAFSFINAYKWLIFLTFQIGVGCFYLLGKQFIRPYYALIITLFFSVTPILFGHAFINSKDIPFMASFIASITMGILFIERVRKHTFQKENINNSSNHFLDDVFHPWIKRYKFFVLTALFSSILLLSQQKFLLEIAHYFLKAIINSKDSILNQILLRMASNIDQISLINYANKALINFTKLGFLFIFLLGVGLWLHHFSTNQLTKNWFRVQFQVFWQEIRQLRLRFVFSLIQEKYFWLAILSLGISSAIRPIGVLTGVIIAIWFILNIGVRSFKWVLSYSLGGFLIMVILWPSIWASPINGFFESVKTMSDFPWKANVLYGGDFIPSWNLPWHYLPTYLSIQLPALIIILFCLGVMIFFAKKELRKSQYLQGIFWLWLMFPILFSIFTKATIYDNFRQFLFITPPIFIFAGIGLQFISKNVRKIYVSLGSMVALILLIIPIGQLHPYQYIYYNEFVGGVEGAFRNYEMDYWNISFKEACEYANTNLEFGSTVAVWGAMDVAEYYTREDIVLIPQKHITDFDNIDYALISTRWNADLNNLNGFSDIFLIERQNAILVRIKDLNSMSSE